MALPKQADRGTAERWASRELLEDKTTAILWLQSCPLNNLINTTHKYSVTMAGRLGAPGSHYSRCALGSYKLRGSFPHRQKGRQGSLPSSRQAQDARVDRLLLPAPCVIPRTPFAWVLRKSTFQSIDLVSKVLRVLTREGNLLWGSRKIKRKPSGTFSWMTCQRFSDWGMEL